MNNLPHCLRLLPLLLSLPLTFANGKDCRIPFNSFSFRSLPALQTGCTQGVAAAYAGVSNGWIVVAGGCNFPGTPAAQGGAKRFYDNIFALSTSNPSKWKHSGRLPAAAAYGVSVTTPDGIVCAGGTDGTRSLSATWRIAAGSDGTVTVTPLPPLPTALDNMAGAADKDGYIYVAGGQSGGTPSHKAYRLKFPGGKSWERLPDFPGPPRLQASAAVQDNATGTAFYLIGGYHSGGTNTSALAYDPTARTWRESAPITVNGKPVAVAGAVCASYGNSCIVCMGGVNRQVFDNALAALGDTAGPGGKARQAAYLLHEPEWYRFNDSPLVYNTITDTWTVLPGNARLARAGAAVADAGIGGRRSLVVINGELKPGIRSDRVTAVSAESHSSFGWINWSVVGIYLVAMLALGYVFMHRGKSADDFFTGGGRIPWWAAGISIFATIISAITYMSIPAKAYATDWKYYPMQIMILVVAFPVVKYYLPFFRRLNASSAYAYLEQRFSYGVRAMASALFMAFMVARMALVLFLPSIALAAVTGIDIFTCIGLMAVITIVYCTMGGMEAVVWGDVVQGVILVGGAVLAAVYLMTQTQGGFAGFMQTGMTDHKFVLFDWSLDYRTPTFWVIIIGGLANNLISYTSDQTVIQRYMTTRDEQSAKRSIFTNAALQIAVSVVFYTIGTGLYTFFKTHPTALDITLDKTDTIFPFFMISQLPQGIAGLLIAALFAATMSTISSNINSVSTAFTLDFYKRWRPQASERATLLTARWAGVAAGAAGTMIAVLMAMADIHSLLDYFNTILGLLTGSVGALFMMGIFFRRINAACALAGFVCGTLTVFYMNYCTQVNFFLFGFASMAVSVGIALLLSLAMPNRKDTGTLTWRALRDRQRQQTAAHTAPTSQKTNP